MYTQHTIINIKRESLEIIPNTIIWLCDFCQGLNNKFEITVVNEPSVFESPKFYCIWPV